MKFNNWEVLHKHFITLGIYPVFYSADLVDVEEINIRQNKVT